ncbi:ABC transporter permease [Cupriavidus sp. UYMU48A]|nr:ABC transporter permease [Cupriavidus sp. UYMU48A]
MRTKTDSALDETGVTSVSVIRTKLARLLLPPGIDTSVIPLLVGRALRGLCDGFVAVLLPSYLLGLGFGQFSVGLISSATLIGSALATILVGVIGSRFPLRRLLILAAVLMAITGVGFAGLSSLWPLLIVAFIGTLNPSSGDVSVFLPLEQARLAEAAAPEARTALFARYSLVGAFSAAVGALAAALPAWISTHAGLSMMAAMRLMFVAYATTGVALWVLYTRLPEQHPQSSTATTALGPSRRIVVHLAMLFSVDAFAGGLVVNALLSLWLMQRFGMSPGAAGHFFFWTGLLTTASQLIAVPLARRIGLLNTMVFTHIPSSAFLIAAAFAPSLTLTLTLLLMRSALSQMDVPTRTAFVMAVVTPAERTAAASLTAVPRSLAAAVGPVLAAGLMTMGWIGAPLLACGVLKIGYDLAILHAFRRVKPLN